MDKELLKALGNLSDALQMLSDSLQKDKKKDKSATGAALQSGNFSKQINEINKGILSLKADNKKILDNQKTIIRLQKQKSGEKAGIFERVGEKVKDVAKGVGTVVLIAGAVLAIGLAFKLIGSVDWMSVIALSVSLPLIAFAFEKIAKMKDLTLKQMLGLVGVTVAMSMAIMLSSRILTHVMPVGFFQLVTVVMIAAAFGAAAIGMGYLMKAFKSISPADALEASIVLPIVLLAVSIAITASSHILKFVQPIGLFQAVTVVLIAYAFGAVSGGLGKMLGAMKGISIEKAKNASKLMPIILIGLSAAIVGSSWLLSHVVPIGLFQALTAIMIAGTFVVLSYAIAPLMKGVKGVKAEDMENGAIIMIGLTGAVVAASWALMMMAPVPYENILKFALVSLSLTVSVIALAVAVRVINALGKPEDYMKGGISIVILSTAIALSSQILSLGNYNVYPSWQWAIGASLSLGLFGIGAVFLGEAAVDPLFDAGLGAIILVAVAVVASDAILSLGVYKSYPGIEWALGTGLALGFFGLGAVLLGTQVANPFFYGGLGAILLVGATIVAADLILSLGNYKSYPGLEWSLGVGLSLGFFGMGAVLLGAQVFNPFFYGGLGAILLVAATVVATDLILGLGEYDNYPKMDWVLSTIAILGSFGTIAVFMAPFSPFILAGAISMLSIAGVIYAIDEIFSDGGFVKYPSSKWTTPAIDVIGKFGEMSVLYALFLPAIISGSISMLAIAGVIYAIDEIFSDGDFASYPDSKWVSGVGSSIHSMANEISYVNDVLGVVGLTKGGAKLLGIVGMIYEVDRIFSSGDFASYPDSKWVSGVGSSIHSMANEISYVNDFLGVVGLTKGGAKLLGIVGIIRTTDDVIGSGSYVKFPDKVWSDSISYTISKFSGLSSIVSFSFGSSLTDLASQISNVSIALAAGDYSKYPKAGWIDGTIYSLQKFKNLLNMLNFSDVGTGVFGRLSNFFTGTNPLKEAVSNISLLAEAFHKLSDAMGEFSGSIENLDADKLTAIRSLSSNVILLSLMDPDQFSDMMDKLEKKSGVFASLLADLEEKKFKSSPTITTSSKTIGKKTDGEMLGEKIDRMTGILADIQSVVGSHGTLKTYLSSIKEHQMAGTSDQHRSDKRLKNIIRKLGVSPSGINIYAFTYKFNMGVVYQGVIAQELLDIKDAVILDKNGFYSVDYSKIDVDFKRLETSDLL